MHNIKNKLQIFCASCGNFIGEYSNHSKLSQQTSSELITNTSLNIVLSITSNKSARKTLVK